MNAWYPTRDKLLEHFFDKLVLADVNVGFSIPALLSFHGFNIHKPILRDEHTHDSMIVYRQVLKGVNKI